MDDVTLVEGTVDTVWAAVKDNVVLGKGLFDDDDFGGLYAWGVCSPVLIVKPGTTAVPRPLAPPSQFVFPSAALTHELPKGQHTPLPQSMGVMRVSSHVSRAWSICPVNSGPHSSTPDAIFMIVVSSRQHRYYKLKK